MDARQVHKYNLLHSNDIKNLLAFSIKLYGIAAIIMALQAKIQVYNQVKLLLQWVLIRSNLRQPVKV